MIAKVIWAEGILLGQQHFQQWDNYWEEQQQLLITSLAPLNWGLYSLVIDETALVNGKFKIRKCGVFFPSGKLINYDSNENEFLGCPLPTKTEKVIEIYLGLPMNHQITGISGYPEASQLTTWKACYQQMIDQFDSKRQREVLLGYPNLVLLTDAKNQETLSTIKIAEVMHTGHGSYQLVKTFIPSIIRLQASIFLSGLLDRYIELIKAKIRLLSERHYSSHGASGEFGHNNLEGFLLLQNFQRILPTLQHWQQYPQCHPQQLFLALTDLIGSLCSFTTTGQVTELPRYQHHNLTDTFAQLDRLLLQLLDAVIPMRMADIKLRRETDTLYLVDSIENSLLIKSRFFIAVYLNSDDAGWVVQFARQVKVASASAMNSIITSALPGVRVTHIQRPPNKLSIKVGYEYFSLEPSGNFWEQVKKDRSLSIFVPHTFIEADIDLVAVQE